MGEGQWRVVLIALFGLAGSLLLRPGGAATYVVSGKAERGTAASAAQRQFLNGAGRQDGGSNPNLNSSSSSFHAFNTVTVAADFDAVGAGSNVDTLAFWEAPDATDTLMFVTSKDISLVEVWKYPFTSPSHQLPALTHSCLKVTSDSATNGVLVDQETDLLYVASNFSRNVCVFSLPGLTYQKTISSGGNYGREPNLAQIELPNGSAWFYVSNDDVVYVHDPQSGQKLDQFTPAKGLETMWGDSFHQVLYIPDENTRTGVYAYQPDGTVYTRDGKSVFGNSTIFSSDGEGILEYTCSADGSRDNGAGLIVVSDQIDSARAGNDYEVFDRRTWAHLGKFKLKLPNGNFVYNTDGIGTTQRASPRYPGGLFAAIQNDTSAAGIGWTKIFAAISAQTGKPFSCSR